MTANPPPIGIPYAMTDPATGARTCPACQLVIGEDYDATGEVLTSNYADHYARQHGAPAAGPRDGRAGMPTTGNFSAGRD